MISNVGYGRVYLDTTDSFTFDCGKSDVTGLTPGGRPRVTDDVVVLAILRAVTDSNDGVVSSSSALIGVDDTAGVRVEDGLVGLN